MVEVKSWGCTQVEALVPIRAERPLGNCGRLRLFTTDGGDGERVGEACSTVSKGSIVACRYDFEVKHTKYIAFVKPVRGDNYVQVSI